MGKICTVLEGDDEVGGISRTTERDGWRFDIGGHRFFTKVKVVEEFWHEILPGEDFMLRPRLSRIYYRGKYYDYPLKPFNALRNLGLVESLRCAGSYAWARARPPKDQGTFEGWVAARFGWRLYRHFFKTYTEKVWGYPGSQLQADWAAQRIKNLNLFNAVKSALFPKKGQREITTLIDQFEYPRLGPGMMWERCRDRVEAAGSKVHMRAIGQPRPPRGRPCRRRQLGNRRGGHRAPGQRRDLFHAAFGAGEGAGPPASRGDPGRRRRPPLPGPHDGGIGRARDGELSR